MARKLLSFRDLTRRADGTANVRAWAAAVVDIPIGRDALETLGAALGDELGRLALATLAIAPEAYGKAAIVGVAGELAHGEAILHPKLGRPLRDLVGSGKAIIPSTLKLGGPGTRIDVPLHGIDDEWDFALLGAVEAGSAEGPLPNEVLVCVAFGARVAT